MEHEPEVSNATPDAAPVRPDAPAAEEPAAAVPAAAAPAAVAPEAVPAAPVVAGPAIATQPTARRGRGARLVNVALGGALVLAVAGVAFAAGRLTAPPAVTAGNLPGGIQINPGKDGQGFVQGRPGGPGGTFTGGPTIEGTVESITATTMTIKTASGETIQIALDGSTTYHAQTDATADDVKTGGKVQVRLDMRAGNGSGNATNPSASDVTVVP